MTIDNMNVQLFATFSTPLRGLSQRFLREIFRIIANCEIGFISKQTILCWESPLISNLILQ